MVISLKDVCTVYYVFFYISFITCDVVVVVVVITCDDIYFATVTEEQTKWPVLAQWSVWMQCNYFGRFCILADLNF